MGLTALSIDVVNIIHKHTYVRITTLCMLDSFITVISKSDAILGAAPVSRQLSQPVKGAWVLFYAQWNKYALFVFICSELRRGGQCLEQSPVCDSVNNQHASLCSFLTTNNEFSYFGFCEVSYVRSQVG